MTFDHRKQILQRYFNQCKQLDKPFHLDFEYLINHPEKINVDDINLMIEENIKLALAKFKNSNKLKGQVKTKKKKKTSNSSAKTNDKTNFKANKRKLNGKCSKKRTKKSKKKGFSKPWGRVIYTGMTQ